MVSTSVSENLIQIICFLSNQNNHDKRIASLSSGKSDFNSLSHRKHDCDFKYVNFKHCLGIDILSTQVN